MELTTSLAVSIGVAALMLFFLGMAVGRSQSSHTLESRILRLEQENHSHEVEFKQLARRHEKLLAEKQAFKNFLVHASEFAREINTELDRPQLAKLLLQIIDQMFQPKQIAILFTSREDKTTLVVETFKGIPDDQARRLKVKFGQGRIGWVAENQLTMERDDFSNQSRVGKTTIENNPPGLRLDLLAPLLSDKDTAGVICVGGAGVHLAEQKKMLKMAADLASAALLNARYFKAIKSDAAHDGLTKLYNKKKFMEMFGRELFQVQNTRDPLSVFLFDIDHFKTFNDTNGHLKGDEVLRITGRLLKAELDDERFFVGRYGGEEFVVALRKTPPEEALKVAEHVRAKIEAYPYPDQSSQPTGTLTISGGVASFPYDGRSTTDLLRHADEALYRAKANGRNRVEAYETEPLGAPVGDHDDYYGAR